MRNMNHGGSIVSTTVVHHHSRMSRTDPQLKVRLPDGMRDRIAEAAKANNRSMNAEIVARLEASFQPSEVDQLGAAAIAKLLEAQQEHLKEWLLENVGARKASHPIADT